MSKRITVIGAGFAGLAAVERLRALDAAAEITLVAPRPQFVFLPSLIWIPTRQRTPEEITVDLQPFLGRHRIHFHAGEVTGLAEGGRRTLTSEGEVENDALLIASGGRFLKKLPGIEHVITPCEGIAAALAIRERLESLSEGTIAVGFGGNPKEPSAMRGGPMFEFLFGIDSLLRKQGRRQRFRLVFFSPAPEPGKRLGPKAVDALLKTMQRRGIETHLGHKMKGFEANRVITEGGEFDADLILFMPGMTGNAWFEDSGLARSEGGLLKADLQCRVQGAERVYVAGDSGSFPGPEWMPKQGHMAVLQAHAAAANLVAELDGRTPSESFRVELMCIIDAMDSGMLVMRNLKRSIVLPRSRVWHWAKRLFEQRYLRKFR